MQELDELRKIIDVLDEEIISLIFERNIVSQKIGAFKLKNNMLVLDKNREEFLINYHKDLSLKYDISSEFVAKLFDLIMSDSRKTQECIK
jgi:chorismate mutase